MYSVQLSELAAMDEAAKNEALTELVQAAMHPNGETGRMLQERIKTFEIRYEMSSTELLEALEEGEQRKTAEIAEWLFWLDALASYEQEARA